jgi:hypothetical protein
MVTSTDRSEYEMSDFMRSRASRDARTLWGELRLMLDWRKIHAYNRMRL